MSNITDHQKALEKEKEELLSDLNGVASRDDVTGHFNTQNNYNEIEADSSDLSTRDESFEDNSALVEELSPELEDVEEALKKISDGTYGVCIICGKKIEEERLDANPSAKTCILHLND